MIKTNSFIFSWDEFGIEAIIPINNFKEIEQNNLLEILKGNKPERNELNNIIRMVIMRAHANPQRHYEVYSIECSPELDEEFWKDFWAKEPQQSADIVRKHGSKLYSGRRIDKPVIT